MSTLFYMDKLLEYQSKDEKMTDYINNFILNSKKIDLNIYLNEHVYFIIEEREYGTGLQLLPREEKKKILVNAYELDIINCWPNFLLLIVNNDPILEKIFKKVETTWIPSRELQYFIINRDAFNMPKKVYLYLIQNLKICDSIEKVYKMNICNMFHKMERFFVDLKYEELTQKYPYLPKSKLFDGIIIHKRIESPDCYKNIRFKLKNISYE